MNTKKLKTIFNKIKIPLFLFLVVALAFFVRFQTAQKYNVMIDEAVLVMDSSRSYKDLFFLNYWNTAHPPFYDLVDKFTVTFNGSDPVNLRLKSQIFGSLSLIFLYLVSLLLTQSSSIAVITVILTVFSGFHIGLSAFSRPYGFQQFFVLGFLYFFLKVFLKKDVKKIRDFSLLLLFSCLATLTDYSFLWVIASIYFILFVDLIKTFIWNKKEFFKTFIYSLQIIFVTTITFILWSPIFFSKIHSAVALESYLDQSLSLPIYKLVGMYVQKMFFIAEEDGIFTGISAFLAIYSVFCLYQYVRFKNENTKKSYLFLVVLTLIPIIVSLVVSYNFSPVFLTRNFFVCSYPLLIFFATVIFKSIPNKVNLSFVMITLLIFQFLTSGAVIRGNFNFTYSIDTLQTRGILYDHSLDKYSVVLDDSVPNSAKGVWSYYLGCFDHNQTCGVNITTVNKLREDSHFVLVSYTKNPYLFDTLKDRYSCTDTNIEQNNKDVRIFDCLPVSK